MNEETVTISKVEYDALQKQSLWLSCLEGAGVDNWEGYDEAIRILEEIENEQTSS